MTRHPLPTARRTALDEAGDEYRYQREARGWTIAEAAFRAGLTEYLVERIEAGHAGHAVRVGALDALAIAYDCDLVVGLRPVGGGDVYGDVDG